MEDTRGDFAERQGKRKRRTDKVGRRGNKRGPVNTTPVLKVVERGYDDPNYLDRAN